MSVFGLTCRHYISLSYRLWHFYTLSFHLSVCPSVCLSVCLSVCQACYMSVSVPTCLSASLRSYVSLSRLSACQGCYPSACLQVCLSVCLSSNLSVSYLFIYCLIYLSGIQRWSEARLPSFTVKCSADWRGHFSNGAALPLIFCLSLGVRLIYHASSPADIQIHFDWRLDGMTPTTTNTANITAALARTHTNAHTVKCDVLHTQNQV